MKNSEWGSTGLSTELYELTAEEIAIVEEATK